MSSPGELMFLCPRQGSLCSYVLTRGAYVPMSSPEWVMLLRSPGELMLLCPHVPISSPEGLCSSVLTRWVYACYVPMPSPKSWPKVYLVEWKVFSKWSISCVFPGSGWFRSSLGEPNPAQLPAVNITPPQHMCAKCKYHRTQRIKTVWKRSIVQSVHLIL